MANTPDPRDFYRVSRAVLMPSLWRESLGRVAIEAMANGIPVLASDRGALPETLGNGGFVFTIPDRCTPSSPLIPTPHEVARWVATIERICDDAPFEARHRALAKTEANRWDPALVAGQYQQLFERVIRRAGPVERRSSRATGRLLTSTQGERWPPELTRATPRRTATICDECAQSKIHHN
jgi:glycosyltransferase involved in cell wall biosynthesis